MKYFLLVPALFAAIILPGCKSPKAKTNPASTPVEKTRIEILDPEASSLLDSLAKIEVIGSGFKWTEGPLYIAEGDYFIFSDVPANKIYKWKEGKDISTYLMPSGNTGAVNNNREPGSNGLLLHPDGHLVLCQHGDRRIAKMIAPINDPKPEFETLAGTYKGKRLNSPNDAVYHPNGDLYFTDPPYGMDNGVNDSARQLDFQGVYRLKPSGQLDIVTRELAYPNGIALSPDGKLLYVASSDGDNPIWMQYELDSNGLSKSQRLFYDVKSDEGRNTGAPDGMKITRKGYLFASGPGGLWVFNPGGKLIARLYTGLASSNCAFSADEKTLFMTCDDYVMRLKMK